VLEIQPSNVEATAELSNIIPTTCNLKTPANHSSSAIASGASTAAGSCPQKTASANANSKCVSPENPLPFVRTYRDDYKLKISPLPLTIDVPIELSPAFIGSHEKTKHPMAPPPTSGPTRLETFSYPSWERYVIQKAT
jgi:RNA polymerase II-associated protein 3